MIHKQISMDEIMNPPKEVKIPEVTGPDAIRIPDDVWENRCMKCVHRCAKNNNPVSKDMLWRSWNYEGIIPCKILGLAKCNDMPGECLSFEPSIWMYGICGSCEHDNNFFDGFCMKKDHAPQRRVCYGTDYGGDERKKDYYSRHRFCVCDDYKPNEYVREKMKEEQDGQRTGDSTTERITEPSVQTV